MPVSGPAALPHPPPPSLPSPGMCADSAGVQVEDLRIRQTKPRDPGGRRPAGDGHWGVQNGNSVDVLVHKFDIQPNMLHCVGSDGFGMYAVFSQGKMANGNLELHRWAQGQVLAAWVGGVRAVQRLLPLPLPRLAVLW